MLILSNQWESMEIQCESILKDSIEITQLKSLDIVLKSIAVLPAVQVSVWMLY